MSLDRIPYLYYYTTIDSLKNFFNYGILSRNKCKERKLLNRHSDISDDAVQSRRSVTNVTTSSSIVRNLHDMVPLFIRPKNATSYRFQQKLCSENDRHGTNFLCCIAIDSNILKQDAIDFVFSNMNMSKDDVLVFDTLKKLDKLRWDILEDSYSYENFGYELHVTFKSAEFNIFPLIEPAFIKNIYVQNEIAMKQVQSALHERPDIQKSLVHVTKTNKSGHDLWHTLADNQLIKAVDQDE